ncbi:MAG: cation-translocating P-type ATPase [Candidatus Zixiibacteriota bacterium]
MPLTNIEARTTRIDCPNCAKTAESEIQGIEGIAGARVDLLNAKVFYSFDTDKADAAALRNKIESLGHFKFVDDPKSKDALLPFSRPLAYSLLGSVLLYAAGALLYFGLDQVIAGTAAFYLATLVGGWDILVRAFSAVRHRRLDINVLMLIAIVGAIIIGDLHEAVVVVLLFGLANMLESYSLWRLSKTLTSISDFTADHALLKRGTTTVSVPPESLVPGDVVILREGMRVPADGVILVGKAFLDFASLTGESQPRSGSEGDEVYAGAVNLDGYLEVTVSAPVQDSRIGKILKLVGEASVRKAKIERFVDRFARIYTPIVIVLAVGVAVIPLLLFAADLSVWVYRALVFLVISCPCALVISTPVAVTTALAAASKLKAVFRGGDALERLATIQTIAFDKTGTLTTGALALTGIVNRSPLSEEELLQIAGSLEQISQHPIAESIMSTCRERSINLREVADSRSIAGVGVEGKISDRRYQIRSSQTQSVDGVGHSVDLCEDDRVIATFSFSDKLRPESQQIVRALRSQGISKLGILSGDTRSNTEHIAKQLQLDFAFGGLMPAQKHERLESLGAGVAMVGDGINDIVALSGSDVSISLARFGNEIPAQHADIILFGGSLSAVPNLIRLGKRTLATIKGNIAFAFAIKVIFLILAVAGYANIWMAVAADMGASLLVIFNSLRLLK